MLIHQNEPLCPLSLLHRFSSFFPLKNGDRLKIVLLSFQSLLICFGHYHASVNILSSLAAFQIGSRDAVAWCDTWSHSVYPSPGANFEIDNPLHAHKNHNGASSILYDRCDTGGCTTFTGSSLHIDPHN